MKKIFNFSYSIISFFFILSCKKDGITQEKLIYLNKNTKLNSLIQWVPCEKKILNEDRNPITLNLECGTINVPLNWDKFDGKKINLSFIRSKAKNDLKRIGTLIVNNRGPGSESIKLANYMSTHSIYKDIAEHFDIIGMDPRGVGESTPIKCTKEWNGNFSFPKNEIEFNELLNENGNYYDSCLEGSGEILNYVDTTIVARDLEALRFALGNEKLNFFGYSYGAVIASKYAELFPENSRALIMDGIFDHSQENALDFAKTEVNAAEKNLSYFSEWCDNNPDCKLPNESILNAFDKMIKETNEHPLVLNGNKKINGVQIQSNTQRYLTLGKVFWPNLANAIKEIVNGNADKFGLFYSSLFFKPSQNAIQCLDYPYKISKWNDYLKFKTEIEAASPHLGAYVQSAKIIQHCIGWKSIRKNPPKKLKILKKQPVLLITTKHDPSTSSEWSQRVLKQIPGSLNINYNGFSHTAFIYSKCIRKYVNDFLINKIKPDLNSTCSD